MLATGTQPNLSEGFRGLGACYGYPVYSYKEGFRGCVLATGTQSTPIRKDSEGVCLLRVPSLLL